MQFDWSLVLDHFLRLGAAMLGGAVIGFEREVTGHWAGLRTHMAVALGAATFAVLGESLSAGDPNALNRVLQGIATGVGFLGAGTILKLAGPQRIKGLTTASSIWLAAAVGAVAGFARYELLLACVALGLVVLAVLRPLSERLGDDHVDKSA
ncbi:MAG: MgtC/SapB family protein [Planctomycetales bacterium]|nr:MgtC/SapB family protein [Planctomycetales bacterium]